MEQRIRTVLGDAARTMRDQSARIETARQSLEDAQKTWKPDQKVIHLTRQSQIV